MTDRTKVAANYCERAAAPIADLHRFVGPVGLTLILLTTFIIYLPALRGAVLWDDEAHITTTGLQSIGGLYRIWFELGATQQYYPLLHTAFWLEHKLWSDSVLGYHLVNVLWHMLSISLVYVILKKLKVPGALLAAAIFATHPVMVESVAWISEQKNTLSAAFYLIAMLVYLRFDESRWRSDYSIALALFVLGLLTKTVTATLPAALLVIFWWQRGTISWKRDVLPLVPFFVMGAAAGLMTAWVERTLIGAEGADFELSVLQRGLLAGRVVWFYLGKLLWPSNLMFIYPQWTIDPAETWQWIFPLATLATTAVLWSVRKRFRGPMAGWLLFAGTLFPVLGFLNLFPFIFSFVADHFQYLASLGIIVLVAAGIAQAISRLAAPARYVGVALCILLLGTLALLASQQSRMYADAITLYRTTIDRNPDCWMALDNLGEELAARGKFEDAFELYRSALRIRPNFALAHNSLGFALTQLGRAPEAIEHINEALRLRPDFTDANLNLGIALRQLGRTDEAIEHIQQVLRVRRDFAEAHSNLGNTLIQAGRVPEGIAELKIAVDEKPNEPKLLNNLGIALMQTGRATEAVEHLEHAVRLKPDYFQAHNSLGLALANIGKTSEATKQFSVALQINPNYANAHCNLGNVLASTGDEKNAIFHYNRAVEIRPEFLEAHYKLGVALTQIGQPDQAIEHYQAALRLKPDYLPAYASLAQTLALMHRSKEAISTVEEGSGVARSTGQKDELKQFEDWLEHYRAELRRAAEAASSSQPPSPRK